MVSNMQLTTICDFSPDRLETACRLYPPVDAEQQVGSIFQNTDIDAIAIATPVSTHYELAKQALLADKHVWLEKPMTEKVESECIASK